MLDLVARLRSESGASVMYISHNLAIVSRLCDRVGVLYAGRLIEEGPSHEVLSDPAATCSSDLALQALACGCARGTAVGSTHSGIAASARAARIEGYACAAMSACACAVSATRARPARHGRAAGMSACHFYEEVPGMPSSPESAPPRSQGPPLDDGVLLRVADLVKSYRAGRSRIHAVDGVSLEVRRGRVKAGARRRIQVKQE